MKQFLTHWLLGTAIAALVFLFVVTLVCAVYVNLILLHVNVALGLVVVAVEVGLVFALLSLFL